MERSPEKKQLVRRPGQKSAADYLREVRERNAAFKKQLETPQMRVLTVWTVYKSPKDYPGHWVLRGHDVPGGPRQECFVSKSYQGILSYVPMGCVRLERNDDDDPVIVETWM